jgi:tol-pal system-associated acyl-CoA thioesterase
MSDTTFSIDFRIYFEDTDAGGIVYHSNYLNFMERTRSEWLWSIPGGYDDLTNNHVQFVVHHASVDWRKPAKLKDHLRCTCAPKHIGRTSVTFEQYVIDAHNPEIIYCSADVRVVTVSLDNGKVKPIPTLIKEYLQHGN